VLKVFLNLWDLRNCKILLLHVHTGFNLFTSMSEVGQGWPKLLECSVGFDKVGFFEGNEYNTANYFEWLFFFHATLSVQHLHVEVTHP
jgi:hypothetical protein